MLVLLLGLLVVVIHFHVFSFLFNFFIGNAVLKLHTHILLSLCIFVIVTMCHFVHLLVGVCLSKNKRITYLLT